MIGAIAGSIDDFVNLFSVWKMNDYAGVEMYI